MNQQISKRIELLDRNNKFSAVDSGYRGLNQ